MAKILFIGATGHIGGEVLDAIFQECPDVEVTALVRSEEKSSQLRSRYSNVKTIIGDLGSLDVIEQASKDARIVITTAPDISHTPTTDAITRGLGTRTSPTYLIHTSGAAITWSDTAHGAHDASAAAIWTDLPPTRLLDPNLPTSRLHVVEDAAVRALTADRGVNLAIVSPTLVYGLARNRDGDHAVPFTLPPLVDAMERLKGGFVVGAGENRQGWVHVVDVAGVYVALVKDALGRSSREKKQKKGELWGPEAYYFATDEELSLREYMEMLAPEVARHLGGVDGGVREVRLEELLRALAGDKGEPMLGDELQAKFYVTEMQARSDRARELLGWKPRGHGGVKAAVAETVDALFAQRR